MRLLCFDPDAGNGPYTCFQVELVPYRAEHFTAARRRQYQEQQGGARGFAFLKASNMFFHKRGHVALRHRGLILLLTGLLRQDVINDCNRVRRDMTMRPRPLHDRVHPLVRATGFPYGFPPMRASIIAARMRPFSIPRSAQRCLWAGRLCAYRRASAYADSHFHIQLETWRW
jgi:hypothetical protein